MYSREGGRIMKKLEDTDLINITGGELSSSLLNSISKIASTIYELGRSFGSSIRRITTGNICQI